MRVGRRWTPDDERGATLIIVALAMVAILGMAALVVDVGGLLVTKRRMVLAADAAAMAAAQSCAANSGDEVSQANQYATANRSNAEPVSFSGCSGPSGTVTVSYQSSKDLVFAPVMGFPNSVDVPATATALYGPVGTVKGAIPIMAFESQMAACGIPQSQPPPGGSLSCDLHYQVGHGGELSTPPFFGTLDLSQWGNASAGKCSVSAAELKGIIDKGGWPDPLTIVPPTTADCADNGASASVYAATVGKTLFFPVVSDTVISDGGPSGGIIVNVLGFVKLTVTDWNPSSADDKTLSVTWAGGTFEGGEPGPGQDFGVRGGRLCDPALANSCDLNS